LISVEFFEGIIKTLRVGVFQATGVPLISRQLEFVLSQILLSDRSFPLL
jgi:hypothetical protein